METPVVKTYRLTITKQDGTTYWIEYFNNLDVAERWLAEEKTRPYWDPTYQSVIEEI